MIPMTARIAIAGAQLTASSGRMGSEILMNPYEPSFRRMAASSTEPTVGAAVCASGSQVCSGHMGTLTAKPRNMAPNTRKAKVPLNAPPEPSWVSSTMSKVRSPKLPDSKYRARKPSSMKAEPNSVNRKNLIAA